MGMMELYKHVADNPEKQEVAEHLVACMAKKIKRDCPDGYKEIFMKLHEEVYGGHFCEALAKKAVDDMDNVDGTHGGHWTMEHAIVLMNQYGIQCNVNDWYYVINMLYSDFAKVLGEDKSIYARLAAAYIEDPDAPADKALKIYLATHDVD